MEIAEKAHAKDYDARIRDIAADPCNEKIPRVDRAGEIVDGHLIMHNGILIKPTAPCYVKLLQGNAGCHEPTEEYIFQEVLKHIPANGSILELGAFWGFYSLWFGKTVANARCLLVEPRKSNLELGKYNFTKNGLKGEFFRQKIGHGYLGVDRFLAAQQVPYLDILHADIQGSELEMLRDAEDSLSQHKIGFVFLGTHSQALHYQCKSILEHHGYDIVAHADFDNGTTCYDGVLVARRPGLEAPERVDIPLRDPEGQTKAENEMRDLKVDPRKPGQLAALQTRLRHTVKARTGDCKRAFNKLILRKSNTDYSPF